VSGVRAPARERARAAGLAERIVRRLPRRVGFEDAAAVLADRILACADGLPEGSHLVLGGSLARGEPSIELRPDGFTLISDIDLLLVHESTLPPEPPEDFVRRHADALPTVSLMTVSLPEFRRLQTSLGHDFKEGGVPLRGPAPAVPPVPLTPRDAVEVFAFGAMLYFGERLAERWTGDDPPWLHYAHGRVCSKVLRSVGMLRGAHAQHDASGLPRELAEHAETELSWLRSPAKRPFPPPGRVWPIFAMALAEFDRFHGGPIRDAVRGSHYEQRPGADFVAEHQALALAMLRGTLERYDPADADPARLRAGKQAAWIDLVRAGAVRPYASPERFFTTRAAGIRDQLLRMKV
jgi:hypothetical protein